MNPADLKCWKCGASLAEVLLPLSRLSKCKSCNADLHVCRMCEFYDTTVNNSCREPIAEKVTDKQRKNFCGYLQPSTRAFSATDNTNQTTAMGQLDDLFGLSDPKKGQNGGSSGPQSAEEQARRKLEDLFNLDKKP
jgi:hypothetical protein